MGRGIRESCGPGFEAELVAGQIRVQVGQVQFSLYLLNYLARSDSVVDFMTNELNEIMI